jgi:hypothetical protein
MSKCSNLRVGSLARVPSSQGLNTTPVDCDFDDARIVLKQDAVGGF